MYTQARKSVYVIKKLNKYKLFIQKVSVIRIKEIIKGVEKFEFEKRKNKKKVQMHA